VRDYTELRWFNTSGKQRGYEIFPTYLNHAKTQPEVVLLGSSCMRWGTLPRFMADQLGQQQDDFEVWSLSIHGGFAPQLDTLIDQSFANGRRPKVVIIEATSSYWNELRDDDTVDQYWEWFAPISSSFDFSSTATWQQRKLGLGRIFDGQKSLWRVASTIPYPKYWQAWQQRLSNSQNLRGGFWTNAQISADLKRGGVLTKKAQENARHELRKQLARSQPLQIGQNWQRHLEYAKEKCRAHNAKLILLATPFGFDYLENKDVAADNQFKAWLRQSTKDTQLINWSNPNDFNSSISDPRLKLQAGDFFNAGHLAPSGALKVSAALSKQLVKLAALHQ